MAIFIISVIVPLTAMIRTWAIYTYILPFNDTLPELILLHTSLHQTPALPFVIPNAILAAFWLTILIAANVRTLLHEKNDSHTAFAYLSGGFATANCAAILLQYETTVNAGMALIGMAVIAAGIVIAAKYIARQTAKRARQA